MKYAADMLWLLFACAHTGPGKAAPQPRVPSLRSADYVHVESRPSDPVVAKAWKHPIDESLAGAAGAVAIDLGSDGVLGPGELKWRATLAGYPWPIVEARVARVPLDEVAADLLVTAEGYAGKDVGLVRARGQAFDQWVLLVGGRRGTLPSIPREPRVGYALQVPGLTLRAVGPDGARVDGSDALPLPVAGEWLVEVADGAGVVATFPLYVGGTTPAAPPFGAMLGAEEAGDLNEELLLQLDTLDGWYGRAAAERDPALDAVARARLRTFLAGKPLPAAQGQLAAAGYFGGTSGECRGPSVAECLDAMWWSIEGHAALGGEWGTVGMAVAPTKEGVAVVVAVADSARAPVEP